MKKLRGQALLMVVTIAGIAGFLAYWLNENYDREKRSLVMKTDFNFHRALQQLQVVKLKLKGLPFDSAHHGNMRVFISEGNGVQRMDVQSVAKGEVVSRINIIRDKLRDSLSKMPVKEGAVVSIDKATIKWQNDSNRLPPPRKGELLELLYGVDSLQDSLKVAEITTTYAELLRKQKLRVPFTILRLDSAQVSPEPMFNQETIGFARPVTYRLKLGNSFPYLLKKISGSLLFAFLLLGITVFSFVVLYRNLLRQQRLAELKNEFISNITHELKTPIATVGVAIEALRNFNAINNPERTKEYLDISSNELQRLGLLVDKVLKLSMFEKKEIDLKYEAVRLKDVVDEVVASLRLQLEKYHARLTVKEEGNTALLADRLHLQSVVFNLLDNALKYGKEEPVIGIETKEEGDRVVLTVSDNGIGIAPEYKARIFDKFFRVPHGDTHNAKGYGLGLSYVAQVVYKHNGEIKVESHPGTGTTFTISLPKTVNA